MADGSDMADSGGALWSPDAEYSAEARFSVGAGELKKNHVDTIKVEVDDFDPKIRVQAFELEASVNDIPTLALDILPVEVQEGGPGSETGVTAPDVKTITGLYYKLLDKAKGLDATATIRIELESNQPNPPASESEQQKIELKEWVLTDVGLSSVNAKSAPVLTVVFKHPAVRLDRTGSIYEEVMNKSALLDVFKYNDGSDIIEYMDALFRKYADPGDDIQFFPLASFTFGGPRESQEKIVEGFRTSLAEYTPGKYIEGNTGGLFLEDLAAGFENNVRTTTGYFARPSAFCESTWSRIVRDLCPAFLTAVVPTYDLPRLKLEPLSPWQKSTRSVSLPFVSTLDVVTTDPAPIIGTAVLKDAQASEHTTDFDVRTQTGSEEEDCTYAFYFPDKVTAGVKQHGEIFNVNEARIVSTIVDIDAGANEHRTDGDAGGDDEGGDLQKASNSVKDSDRTIMDEAYAKAMFLINYRKNCKASITATPMFKDENGKMLYPGRVVSVKDKSDVLFSGFVIKYLTKGSSKGGCVTFMEMTHARPGDTSSMLVEDGTENPCYKEADHSDG